MTKTIKQSNKAPRHLRKESAAFFETVLADYVLDDHHLILLTRACESLDRIEEAREIIKKEGLTYRERFHSSKANPAVATAVFRTPLFTRGTVFSSRWSSRSRNATQAFRSASLPQVRPAYPHRSSYRDRY